ncbi:hypothetical protein [Luteipulveratus halotolerans]|uniref:hypothetical protein n=1 Tax=Luteipulveratus halotolerans TaxID=1631356 RepID=UPI0012F863BB|nr:hypothetical protein [Luteipulveratus halotolerans]
MTPEQPMPDWLARLEAEIEHEDAEDALLPDDAERPEIITYEGCADAGCLRRRRASSVTGFHD